MNELKCLICEVVSRIIITSVLLINMKRLIQDKSGLLTTAKCLLFVVVCLLIRSVIMYEHGAKELLVFHIIETTLMSTLLIYTFVKYVNSICDVNNEIFEIEKFQRTINEIDTEPGLTEIRNNDIKEKTKDLLDRCYELKAQICS